MKKISLLFFVLITSLFNAQVNVTWSGGGATEFYSEAANWTSSVVPTTTNNVVFDGTSVKNCRIDIPISILGMSINAGYTGVVTVTSNTFVTLTGSYAQADGTFNSTSDSLTIIGGQFNKTGGTFNHNSGAVLFYVNGTAPSNTLTINGSPVFNRLILWPGTGTQQRNVNFGTSTTTETLSIRGGTFSFAYTGNLAVHSLLVLRSTGNQAPSSNTGTFTLGGAGDFTVNSTQNAQSRDRLPNLVFNTTGNIYLNNFISVQGNWTLSSGTIVPQLSTVCFFGATSSIIGTGNQFYNIYINGANMFFPSNTEVRVGGVIWFISGAASFPTTSLLGLNGTGYQELRNFFGTTINLGSVRIYNNGSRSVALGNAVGARYVIMDSLKLDGSVTFGTLNHLILNSSTTLKARIAQLGPSSVINGTVTVRTVIPGGFTGWANMGVPGVRNQTVKSWDTYSVSGGTTGLPMTCNGCDWDENSISNGPFTSIQGWDESTNAYTNLVGSSPLSPGTGYWLYVGTGPSTTSNLTLVNTGTLVQGNVSVPLTNNSSGYNLVANPYASPVRWSRVLAASTNVNNEINIWNADLGVNTSCSGTFCTHPVSTGASDVIQAGQAFYVVASAAGSVNFQESHKVAFNTGSNPLLRPAGPTVADEGTFRLRLSDNNGYEDYAAFRTHQDASFHYDGNLDAHKIFQSPGYAGYPGPYTKYTTISSKDDLNEDYSINSLPILTNTVSIPLLVRVAVSGPHKIEPIGIENFNTCVFLRDKLTDTYHNLKTDGAYNFTISDTVTTPRFEIVMCQQRAANPNSIAELLSGEKLFIGQDDKSVFVTTHLLQNSKAKISAYNLMGQKVMEDIVVEGAENLTRLNLNLHNQVVIIKVNTDNEGLTKKVLVH